MHREPGPGQPDDSPATGLSPASARAPGEEARHDGTDTGPARHAAPDEDDLAALGYGGDFHRSMNLWSNIALGFTYLSPLVGVYSLFAYSLSLGGPAAIWWIVIVGCGQMLVALVFGEVVSQYPLAGGIYPWCRRLWDRKYAWIVSWVYVWAVIVTVTAVAEFGGGFVAALFGIESTKEVGLITAIALLLLALAFNFSGTHVLARIARIGLAAELIGVIALGVYLLLFHRENSFSVFFESFGAGGDQAYIVTFLGAALSGLFLFYGFEACGSVAEEVNDPTRRIPRAMILTITIGGVSGLHVVRRLRPRRAGPAGDRGRQGDRPDPVDPRGRAGPLGIEGVPAHRDHRVHLLRAVPAGGGQPAALRLVPGQHAAVQPVAREDVGPARGPDQRPAGRLRGADHPVPVRLLAAGRAGPGDGVRGDGHLHRLPGRRAGGAAAAAARAGGRPAAGTSAATGCSSTAAPWPTGSSR